MPKISCIASSGNSYTEKLLFNLCHLASIWDFSYIYIYVVIKCQIVFFWQMWFYRKTMVD